MKASVRLPVPPPQQRSSSSSRRTTVSAGSSGQNSRKDFDSTDSKFDEQNDVIREIEAELFDWNGDVPPIPNNNTLPPLHLIDLVEGPFWMEIFIAAGLLVCLDALLYSFTFLPLRIAWAARLARLPEVTKLSPRHKFALSLGFIVIMGSMLLYLLIDLREIYTKIEAQMNWARLYFVFSVFDLFDFLLMRVGSRVIGALVWSCNQGTDSDISLSLGASLIYVVVHGAIMALHVSTLLVSMSQGSELLSLLSNVKISEYKGGLLKKYTSSDDLFEDCLDDVLARFKWITSFTVIILSGVSDWGTIVRAFVLCWLTDTFLCFIKHSSLRLIERPEMTATMVVADDQQSSSSSTAVQRMTGNRSPQALGLVRRTSLESSQLPELNDRPGFSSTTRRQQSLNLATWKEKPAVHKERLRRPTSPMRSTAPDAWKSMPLMTRGKAANNDAIELSGESDDQGDGSGMDEDRENKTNTDLMSAVNDDNSDAGTAVDAPAEGNKATLEITKEVYLVCRQKLLYQYIRAPLIGVGDSQMEQTTRFDLVVLPITCMLTMLLMTLCIVHPLYAAFGIPVGWLLLCLLKVGIRLLLRRQAQNLHNVPLTQASVSLPELVRLLIYKITSRRHKPKKS
eukprot:Clim_evm8s205 gene=Clim_evmTU8s205